MLHPSDQFCTPEPTSLAPASDPRAVRGVMRSGVVTATWLQASDNESATRGDHSLDLAAPPPDRFCQ